MTTFVMYAAAIISVAIVIFMLIKKMDIKITLFLMGIVLMFVGCALGNPLGGEDFVSTGSVFLDPLKVIADQFKSTISSAGFIILILGGYSAYMSAINANSVTVNVLTKPIAKIKSVYILVPIVFLLGNLLSLVIPSASNLAVILLATLYPILIKAGMSSLTAAGIIATTATIVPTPLGSDNVAIAAELANTTEFAGLTATDYVFKYHAIVSIPTLLIMAAIHFFWQKRCDKKAGVIESKAVESKDVEEIKGGLLYKTVYAILPLLPIILLIGSFAVQKIIERMRSMLPFADMIKLSDEETALLTPYENPDEAANYLLDHGIKIVAVTLGKEGVLICNRKDHQKVSGFSSQVVDTTGAGDSFWGGFMSQFVKSKLNPEDCSIEELKKFARYGNAVASLCIEKKGGILSIPEEKETFKRLQISV